MKLQQRPSLSRYARSSLPKVEHPFGAFVGAALVAIQFYPHFKATKTSEAGNNVGIFALSPAFG